MQITVSNTASVVQCSLALQLQGSEEYMDTYSLNPIAEGGSVTFRDYSVTDEGYSLYEYDYTFRFGNWYMETTYEGRDCDGSYSSRQEFLWDGNNWVKLGRGVYRDHSAEAMGY